MVTLALDFNRDGLGRIVSAVLPDASTIGLSWDEEGRLTGVTPPGQPEHTLSYDPVGRMTDYDPPPTDALDPNSVTPVALAYDDDHRLTGITLASGDSISVGYDGVTGRVSTVSTGGSLSVTPSYDLQGRLVGVAGPYATDLSMSYDGGVLSSVSWSGAATGTVSRTLDSQGRVGSTAINGGMTANYGYDDDGLMALAGQATLTRDIASGRLSALAVGTLSQDFTHNSFGELDGTTLTHGGSTLYGYDLERDNLGRITKDTQTVDGVTTVWDYTYDDRGRLETVDKDGVAYESYTYDDNGNRLSVTKGGVTTNATYDDQDRIQTMGTASFVFDDDGNLIQKTDGLDDWYYGYDAFGNLTGVTLPDGTKIEYDYDSAGRRVARYVDGAFDRGWLWEGQLNPVAEVDEFGNVTARYVYGSRGHVPDYVVVGGVTYQLLTDFRGSVRRAVDVANGSVAWTVEYGPWGEVVSATGISVGSFGFAGGLWDADTELVQFGARPYDAESGRWLMRDPILFGGGQANLYAYVDADPIGRIDPDGLSWFQDKFTEFDQSAAPDFIIGWGDTVSFGIGAIIRKGFTNLDDVVNYSQAYAWGSLAGLATQACMAGPSAAAGEELAIGANGARIAPWGNRGHYEPHPTGRYPHYHRRVKGTNGKTKSGQSKKRHRPWDLHPDDGSFWDRF